jgi:hypothetical protein
MAGEKLKELRREAEAVEDREEARRLYDQVMSIAADLARKFSFGKRRKRRN